ncbi:MAG: prolipoprotein diacylglyceryl transferase [Imperialibacter sp.]|uniref:prolipoprotein diacylglyceryl transferase n=1 Tax=Imperialibacter sp. TaxID=2038411 RepID=UPI0032EF4BEE
MHPEFISFELFGKPVTIHFYGLLIALGATLGYFYAAKTAKRELGIESDVIQGLARWVIIAAFVGGKLFYYFESPAYYFGEPANMLKNFRTGFVFYGSLIFAIPTVIWYFRKHKLPFWPMMDLVAVTGCIVHVCGRMGCLFAGCCYGKPTDMPWGISFSDTLSQAKPLNTPLHPTQLYEIFLILSILVVLLMFKRHKRFEGQLFFLYIMMYAVGRSVTEIFRGDIRRGFIIENVLSHSQLISLVLISLVGIFYYRFSKKQKPIVKRKP